MKRRTAKAARDGESMRIGKIKVPISNREKIFWPGEGFTKGDLLDYYADMADVILPYLKDRPQSLHRFPNGIRQKGFYQKHVPPEQIPGWAKTARIYSESNDEYISSLICNNAATLIYMINLGCIEINPWNSTYKKEDKPNWMVIDLDPLDIAFREVVKTALTVKEVLEESGVECYCKTSGATGLHIFIPLAGKMKYEVVRKMAEFIANSVNRRIPDITSVKRNPSKRKKKVYLDFLQNSRGQTLAAPYSVRPRAGATVSTPLKWEEVNHRLNPKNFTMKNSRKRFDKFGDLWKPVLGKGINAATILKKMKEEE